MNIIPNNIQAKEFRYRAECRDQLQHKGDLYVGTGTTEEVALDDGTTKNMCKTEPLYRTTDGLAPASDDSNQPTNGMALLIDNSNSKGWKIGQIETAGIKDGAITEVKLSKEYYIKNNSIDFAADRLTGALPYISWSKQSNIAGRPSTLILQAPLQSTERTTTILNLPITNSTGTLVTKEQLENGEIVAKQASYASSDTTLGTIGERLVSLESSLFYPLCLTDEQLSMGTLDQTEIGKGVFYIEYDRCWCILENVRRDGTSYSSEQTLLFGAHTMFQEDNGESQLRIYQAVFTPLGKLTIRSGWLYQPRDEQKAAVVKFSGTKQTGKFYYRKLK